MYLLCIVIKLSQYIIRMTSVKIVSSVVPAHRRLKALPNAFGLTQGLRFEGTVYSFAQHLCKGYQGGYWEYVTTSNGAFFMHPTNKQHFQCENGFVGTLSAEASGIVLSLYSLSNLSFEASDDRFAECFHSLRDYGLQHKEANLISQACD